MRSGAGSHRYIIETSEGKFDLLTYGAMEFTIPDILTDLDHLFKRVTERYKNKNSRL